MKGFKEFIMRGNLIQTAVAFIIGTAFAAVVSTFTNVILSLIALVLGGREPNFDNWAPGGIPVGTFLTALISFLMVAAVVYFAIVKPMNALEARRKKGQEDEGIPPTEADLLTEIRDLLAGKRGAERSAGDVQA
ncbi:large conductance mechanosensitive channel protein MscL [Propionibacterium acidifaciens]|uniref:Large conductance mechanosensitive channel protein n=1 Tax=Propionibacterium acidifaciens F0233 TaxID=553198 RepID=U2QU42_9ACTN|nr:large conductance mechanosensitive channel protein MscL [Propionibacterium acidifaciens]AYW77382.1 large conductance mechanosensitive channel protein MscL [Propionibacterium acidifaciens]ERK60031.1 large conductance mechanosensitive channel protein [Propionibacterium acidifaciens F0233]